MQCRVLPSLFVADVELIVLRKPKQKAAASPRAVEYQPSVLDRGDCVTDKRDMNGATGVDTTGTIHERGVCLTGRTHVIDRMDEFVRICSPGPFARPPQTLTKRASCGVTSAPSRENTTGWK